MPLLQDLSSYIIPGVAILISVLTFIATRYDTRYKAEVEYIERLEKRVVVLETAAESARKQLQECRDGRHELHKEILELRRQLFFSKS